MLLALIAWSDSNMAGICFGDSKQQAFTLAGPHVSNVLSFEDPSPADRRHGGRIYRILYGPPQAEGPGWD